MQKRKLIKENNYNVVGFYAFLLSTLMTDTLCSSLNFCHPREAGILYANLPGTTKVKGWLWLLVSLLYYFVNSHFYLRWLTRSHLWWDDKRGKDYCIEKYCRASRMIMRWYSPALLFWLFLFIYSFVNSHFYFFWLTRSHLRWDDKMGKAYCTE